MRPTEVFADQVKRLRKGRGWTQEQLGLRLKSLGVDLDRTKIAKIEAGNRAVSLDEMFGIAAALDAAPVFLLIPWGDDDEVEITPTIRGEAFGVRNWFRGLGIIHGQNIYRYMMQRPPSHQPTSEVLEEALRTVLDAEAQQAAAAGNWKMKSATVHEDEKGTWHIEDDKEE